MRIAVRRKPEEVALDRLSSNISQQQYFKVGDQVKVGDTFVVTVNSVKTSKGDQFTKPKTGNTFLVVDVTIKNT
jgi:hypothetical protein